MAAKHARHDMREDKNFRGTDILVELSGTDPSETTAQYLYCAVVTDFCTVVTDFCTVLQIFALFWMMFGINCTRINQSQPRNISLYIIKEVIS